MQNQNNIYKTLEDLKNNKISIKTAQQKIQGFQDLGFAKIDLARKQNQGFCEVIFGQSKSPEQILKISQELINSGENNILVTRVSQEAQEFLNNNLKKLNINIKIYNNAKLAVINPNEQELTGNVLVICAGTSDLNIAEEALITARTMGANASLICDVGVAGIHRLLSKTQIMREANVLVVVAGMEGALPSVVAGLVERPVIAVPTSVGYGASLGGVAALLAMLNSCASGVSVVNIDNGFGAGFQAAQINRLGNKN